MTLKKQNHSISLQNGNIRRLWLLHIHTIPCCAVHRESLLKGIAGLDGTPVLLSAPPWFPLRHSDVIAPAQQWHHCSRPCFWGHNPLYLGQMQWQQNRSRALSVWGFPHKWATSGPFERKGHWRQAWPMALSGESVFYPKAHTQRGKLWVVLGKDSEDRIIKGDPCTLLKKILFVIPEFSPEENISQTTLGANFYCHRNHRFPFIHCRTFASLT